MTQHCHIACRRLSFAPEEKKKYEALKSTIFENLVRIEELDYGYCFVLKHGQSLLRDLAEWMPLENKCCPFLQMALLLYQDEYVRLQMTGPQQVKGFLLQELEFTELPCTLKTPKIKIDISL